MFWVESRDVPRAWGGCLLGLFKEQEGGGVGVGPHAWGGFAVPVTVMGSPEGVLMGSAVSHLPWARLLAVWCAWR